MDKVSMGIVMFFNKTRHTDLFGAGEYSDLYQLARDGDWTFEVLQEMVAKLKRVAAIGGCVLHLSVPYDKIALKRCGFWSGY